MEERAMHNDSTTQNFTDLPPINAAEVARGTVLAILCLISAIGNTWALFFLLRRLRDRDSVFSLSLLNLCVADLITTAFRMGGVAIWTLTVVWLAGEPMCKIFKFFQVFGSNASTQLITFIGIDRALSVRYPIVSISSAQLRVKYLLVAAWGTSALCSIPQAFLFRLEEVLVEGKATGVHECACVVGPSMNFGYSMFVFSTSFVLPVLLLTASYWAIFVTLRKRSAEKLTLNYSARKFDACSANCADKPSAEAGQVSLSCDVHNECSTAGARYVQRSQATMGNVSVGCKRQDNRKMLFQRARRQSSLTFFIVVLTFLLCWTPYYIMYLVFSVTHYVDWLHDAPAIDEPWAAEVAYWINLFTHLNTLLNPLIYRSIKIDSFERMLKGNDAAKKRDQSCQSYV